MKTSKTLTLFIGFLTALTCYGQTSFAATWSRFFDSAASGFDEVSFVSAESDGTFFVSGYFDDDNFLVQRLDANGDPLWQRYYNASGNDRLYSGKKTSDGGYVLVGETDLSGDKDLMVVKIDYSGNVTWSKRYGAVGSDEVGFEIIQSSDGGYVAIGNTNLNDGVAGVDIYIVKISSTGVLQWDSTYGGDPSIIGNDDLDYIYDIKENLDGSYTAVGTTYSFGGVLDNEHDGLILHIKSDGTLDPLKPSETYRNLITPSVPFNSSIFFESISDSVSVGGYTVSGMVHQDNGGNIYEGLVMSFDSLGNIRWSNMYGDGTTEEDRFETHKMLGSVDVLIAETDIFSTASFDSMMVAIDDFTGNFQSAVVHTDNSYMPSIPNFLLAFDTTSDGGFVFVGRQNFPGGGKKNSDMWVLKTNSNFGMDDINCSNNQSVVLTQTPITFTVSNPTVITQTSIGTENNILLGETSPSVLMNSFCASCFVVSGSDPVDAGTVNELTIDVLNTWGNYADLYTGVYNLIFSGLGSVGGNNPEVEGADFGLSTPVSFTNGQSDALAATLIAYKAETSTVDVTDGVADSSLVSCAGGLPLTVNGLGLSGYQLSATSPQTVGTGWTETVQAVDMYGNVRTADNHSFNVTNSGSATFFTNGTFSIPTATYTLISGVASIFLNDNNAETITITADDGTFNGTSGPIVVNPKAPVAGGRPSGGGGSAPLPASTTLRSSAEEASYETLSCLKKQTPEYLFSDTSGHFGESAINLLAETLSDSMYVTVGYSDSNNSHEFRPDQPVTRAEFLKMAMTSNCVSLKSFNSGSSSDKTFADISLDSNAWYKDFVYSAAESGIVSGYTDGTFGPDKAITRAEATKILVNVQHLMDEGYKGTKYFDDVEESDWYFDYVSSGKENELIYGAEDGEGKSVFNPNNNISRAETALILVRIFNLRDYVSFTGSNAEDYEYVSKSDMQASLLSVGSEGIIIPLLIGLGAGGTGLTVYLRGQRKGKK
ncbi:hypothetical protein C0416_04805 [bacterium]|nr:hypothetical protein [bacterium]